MTVPRHATADHRDIDLTCPDLAALDLIETTGSRFCEQLIAELREAIERIR